MLGGVWGEVCDVGYVLRTVRAGEEWGLGFHGLHGVARRGAAKRVSEVSEVTM